ncbi:MAG TPA: hydrogenase nickel incorporation protein HypB [Steroidobacteraceae bacterium]|nr:hydrogenase nickel incorporation protein HypB [Steroidobacteraceae bacterium]
MCETCGCAVATERPAATETITVMRGILDQNAAQAAHNRAHFEAHDVLALNLMSAPGSGKTALLERTIDELAGRLRCAVIEGDLETDNDARRIRRHGVPAIQITTGATCHLDAAMVHEALHQLPLAGLDVVFIENVGNLVCPASFALGTHADIALLSVPEGDDKAAKYPVMFRAASLVLVSKADLLPVFEDFSVAAVRTAVQALANPAPVLTVSVKSGVGILDWVEWLCAAVAARRARPGAEPSRAPAHFSAAPFAQPS